MFKFCFFFQNIYIKFISCLRSTALLYFLRLEISPDTDIDSVLIFQCCFISEVVPEAPVEDHKSDPSPFMLFLLLYFSLEHSIVPRIFSSLVHLFRRHLQLEFELPFVSFYLLSC